MEGDPCPETGSVPDSPKDSKRASELGGIKKVDEPVPGPIASLRFYERHDFPSSIWAEYLPALFNLAFSQHRECIPDTDQASGRHLAIELALVAPPVEDGRFVEARDPERYYAK